MPNHKPLPVRISADQVERIDRLRGELIPRERYVRHLLERAIAAEERRVAKTAKR